MIEFREALYLNCVPVWCLLVCTVEWAFSSKPRIVLSVTVTVPTVQPSVSPLRVYQGFSTFKGSVWEQTKEKRVRVGQIGQISHTVAQSA